jgi:hypothetical protein
MAVHRQAQAGGEVGANGEFYAGGQFIATVDRPKGKAKPRKPRKVQIAPGGWVEVAGDCNAIYAFLAGSYALYNASTDTFAPYAFHTLSAEARATYTAMIEAYNAGRRVYRYETMEVVG